MFILLLRLDNLQICNYLGWLLALKYVLCIFFGTWCLMGVLLLFGIVRKNKRMIFFRVVITAALISTTDLLWVNCFKKMMKSNIFSIELFTRSFEYDWSNCRNSHRHQGEWI